MMEIYTPISNSICNDETESNPVISNFSKSEIEFYERIKAPLSLLIKEPSKEVINKILSFSKSL